MRIVNVNPYPPLKCRAPGAPCGNAAKHIATIQRDPNVLSYASIHLCDGHLEQLRKIAENEDDD